MSDSERSPLLSATDRSSNVTADHSLETTPLLVSGDATPRYDGEERQPGADDAASVRSRRSDISNASSVKKSRRRWPSIIAMVLLGLGSIAIIVGGFFVPAAVEEYAKEAAVLEPTNLSLESITATGVRARIQANFRLDGSRVRNEHVRRVGRMTTWVVRALGTEETKVNVYLPEYGNILLGSAIVPPIVLNIVDGQTTSIDFVTELSPGDAEGIRTIANDWLEGRLGELRLRGKTDIQLKSGLIPLGTHSISESLVLEAKNIPDIPAYNITRK